METPSSDIVRRVERLLGTSILHWARVLGGYTPAARWIARGAARSAFVKVATDELTAQQLRREARTYGAVTASFMPQFFGFDDNPHTPILAIADLSSARWPPPWRPKDVPGVLDAVRRMHATPCDLPRFEDVHRTSPGWLKVAEDPRPFLALGYVTPAWLDANLTALIKAEADCETSGEALTHWDLRSDNICLTANGAVLVDWAEACRSNARLDLGFWCPSLAYEGGPCRKSCYPMSPQSPRGSPASSPAEPGCP
jgi:hypothetical protein